MALNCKNDILTFLKYNPELKNRLLDEFEEKKGNHIVKDNLACLKGSPLFFKILGKSALKLAFIFIVLKGINSALDSEFLHDMTDPHIFGLISASYFSFNLVSNFAKKMKFTKNSSTFEEAKLVFSEIFYDTIKSKNSITRQKALFDNTYISIDAMSIISEYIDRETFSMILDDKLTYSQLGLQNKKDIRNELKIHQQRQQRQAASVLEAKEKEEKQKTKKVKKEELLDYLYK